MFKKDSCWVVIHRGFDVLGEDKQIIITCATKYNAMRIFFTLYPKLKRKFSRIPFRENIGNPNNNKITEYSCEAITNPRIYIKAYKSDFIDLWKNGNKIEVPGYAQKVEIKYIH